MRSDAILSEAVLVRIERSIQCDAVMRGADERVGNWSWEQQYLWMLC